MLFQIIKIGATLIWSKYKQSNSRNGAVSGAIKDLFEYSLTPISSDNKKIVTSALLQWTANPKFLDFWKQSYLYGLKDKSKAFESFSSITGLAHSVGGVQIAEVLLPHFLQHLETNRIRNEPKYLAARQSAFNQPVLEVYTPSLNKPIEVLGRLPEEFFLGEWHSWFTELKLVDDLILNQKIITASIALSDIRNRSQFSEADMRLQFAILEAEGPLLLQLGRTDDSLLMLQQALTIVPSDPDALAAVARAYIQKNQYDKALPLAEAALAVNHTSPIVIATYLLVHAYLGHLKIFGEFAEHPEWWLMPEVHTALGHAMALDNDF